MNTTDELFLQALDAALCGGQVRWEQSIAEEDWRTLIEMARIHHVLPMVFGAVYACPAIGNASAQLMKACKRDAMQQVMIQAAKTADALKLLTHLKQVGVTPLVVKGMVCRNLYPAPDYRVSADEDVLIPAAQFSVCHQAMLSFGMIPADPALDPETSYEIPYRKPGTGLYIELHKTLFPADSDAYGDFNRFFEEVHSTSVTVEIQGIPVATLNPTDHLFYLICHAYKHFLHSGFGLRQVCDIIMFANTWGNDIRWREVLDRCDQIRATLFAAAIFKIGRKYLVFSPEQACYPPHWRHIIVDEKPMLEDLLQAGIYGSADQDRVHSSSITINAVAAQKKGKSTSGSVLKTIFPSAKSMEARYPYLKNHPVLLPVAWADRIVKYHRETRSGKKNAGITLQIGSDRLALLRQYGILDERR